MFPRLTLAIASLLALTIAPLQAQQPPPPTAQLEAMKKVAWLVGDWQGEGWIEFGGQRHVFRGNETVQSKLNGLVLVVEGHHKAKEGGQVMHEAFGLITYENQAKRYRFQGLTTRGNHEDTEAKVGDKDIVWKMKIPGFGDVRYTIKLDDKGRWFEIGEVTQDGSTWKKFFEMTLEKAQRK